MSVSTGIWLQFMAFQQMSWSRFGRICHLTLPKCAFECGFIWKLQLGVRDGSDCWGSVPLGNSSAPNENRDAQSTLCVPHTLRYPGRLCPSCLCCLSLCSEQPWHFPWSFWNVPNAMRKRYLCQESSSDDSSQIPAWRVLIVLLPLSIVCSLPSMKFNPTQHFFFHSWECHTLAFQYITSKMLPAWDPVGSAGADEKCWECGALCVSILNGMALVSLLVFQTRQMKQFGHPKNTGTINPPPLCVCDAAQQFWNSAGKMKNNFCCEK